MTLRVIIFHSSLHDTFAELNIGLFQAHEFTLNFDETNLMKVEDSLLLGCDTVVEWLYPHVVGHFNQHLNSLTHWQSVHSKIRFWVPTDTVSTPKSGFEYPVTQCRILEEQNPQIDLYKTSKFINFATNSKTCSDLNICNGNKAVHAIVTAKCFCLQISNKLNWRKSHLIRYPQFSMVCHECSHTCYFNIFLKLVHLCIFIASCLRLCFGVNSTDSTTVYTIQKRMTSFMTGVKEKDLFWWII